MAKTQGPLMSLSASGTLGKTATYIRGRGYNATRAYSLRRRDARSASQLPLRSNFRDAVLAFQSLTDEQKTELNLKAKARRRTGYNYFLSLWMKGAIPSFEVTSLVLPSLGENISVEGGLSWSSPTAIQAEGGNASCNSSGAASVADHTVRLGKNGLLVGDNKALTDISWGSTQTVVYGSLSDLWGVSWSVSDIKNDLSANLRVRFDNDDISNILRGSGFDFSSIPDEAVIFGIEFSLNRRALTVVGRSAQPFWFKIRVRYYLLTIP